jgi:hypothetical protein
MSLLQGEDGRGKEGPNGQGMEALPTKTYVDRRVEAWGRRLFDGNGDLKKDELAIAMTQIWDSIRSLDERISRLSSDTVEIVQLMRAESLRDFKKMLAHVDEMDRMIIDAIYEDEEDDEGEEEGTEDGKE